MTNPAGNCFRCADDAPLQTYQVDVAGKAVGTMRLCDPCAGDVDELPNLPSPGSNAGSNGAGNWRPGPDATGPT